MSHPLVNLVLDGLTLSSRTFLPTYGWGLLGFPFLFMGIREMGLTRTVPVAQAQAQAQPGRVGGGGASIDRGRGKQHRAAKDLTESGDSWNQGR